MLTRFDVTDRDLNINRAHDPIHHLNFHSVNWFSVWLITLSTFYTLDSDITLRWLREGALYLGNLASLIRTKPQKDYCKDSEYK